MKCLEQGRHGAKADDRLPNQDGTTDPTILGGIREAGRAGAQQEQATPATPTQAGEVAETHGDAVKTAATTAPRTEKSGKYFVLTP